MTTTGAMQLPSLPSYPMARRCPLDPADELDVLRSERPVAKVRIWDGSEPWLVTGFDNVRAVLGDNRFSADFRHPGYPGSSAAVRKSRETSPWFVNIDDPDHARFRAMLTGEFTVRRIENMRPAITCTVDELIDTMLASGPPTNLIESFALALPSVVVCQMFGLPYADRVFWQTHSRALFDVRSSPEEGKRADTELRNYLTDVLAQKERDPGDDLLSRLATRFISTGKLSRTDAGAMALLLLVAGHETTANMIGLGLVALLQHPEQLAEVRDGDAPTLLRAVEELLRYLTVVQTGRRRVATEDVELDGVTIRAGEGIIASEPAANRDPGQFRHPDDLDIHRSDNPHLAFGYGVHRCLGQPLARLELQIAYPALLNRLPNLRLAVDESELTYRDSMIVYGVDTLPVTWDAAS